MIIYTYQIPKWRQFQHLGIPLIDTTVKSGVIQLAPDWSMVMQHKQKRLSDQEYTRLYREIFDYWWFRDPDYFDRLLQLPEVAFGCYCKAHSFCHRYLLVDFLATITTVDYRGELL